LANSETPSSPASIASGGLAIGSPFFTWSLVNCDAKTLSDTDACGQLFWVYEDDTNDTSDDLTFSMVVTQSKNYILVISVNEGPNPFGAELVYVYDAVAFGTIGKHKSPGNGWCSTVEVTCVNPHAGLANVVITTSVGIYSATQKFQINLQ
jgi:hypothetical protein